MDIQCSRCKHMNYERSNRAARYCARCGHALANEAVGVAALAPKATAAAADTSLPPRLLFPTPENEIKSRASAALVSGLAALVWPLVGIFGLTIGLTVRKEIQNGAENRGQLKKANVGIVCGTIGLIRDLSVICILPMLRR